jgi:hypothetical protein
MLISTASAPSVGFAQGCREICRETRDGGMEICSLLAADAPWYSLGCAVLVNTAYGLCLATCEGLNEIL